jgi:hypothetical protein
MYPRMFVASVLLISCTKKTSVLSHRLKSNISTLARDVTPFILSVAIFTVSILPLGVVREAVMLLCTLWLSVHLYWPSGLAAFTFVRLFSNPSTPIF